MSQTTGTAKKKILIIDDEKHVVTYLETLLQDNGYDTISAYDGKVAMEKVKSERPDLVCLDITMPVQSGNPLSYVRSIQRALGIEESEEAVNRLNLREQLQKSIQGASPDALRKALEALKKAGKMDL